MQFSEVFKILRYFLLAFLCFNLLIANPASCNLSCLSNNSLSEHPIRRHFYEQDPFSMTLVAASKAHLSEVVFKGTLMSVLVQRNGVVRATFGTDKILKPLNHGLPKHGDLEVMYFRKPDRTNVTDKDCLFDVNENNLKLGTQYVVFGRFVPGTRTSVTASAFPVVYEKRIFNAIKRVVCEGCAEPPRITGLKKNVQTVTRKKIKLYCHVSGNPIPWIEWYKDGQPISNLRKKRIKVRTKRKNSRLVIRQSRIRDQGVYECRAVNIVQNSPVAAKATVTITKKTTTKKLRPSTIATTVSSLWPTEKCPNDDFCLNGGTCTFYRDVREYVCHCADGYVGLRCDFKDVKSSYGGIKNVDKEHNRLYVTIIVLFVVLSCLNWGGLIVCWKCCFRYQYKVFKELQQRTPPSDIYYEADGTLMNQQNCDDIHCSSRKPSAQSSNLKFMEEKSRSPTLNENNIEIPTLDKQSKINAEETLLLSNNIRQTTL